MKKFIYSIKNKKLRRSLELLQARKITIRTAAKLADISYVKMLDLSSKVGIDIGYSLNELRK